MRKSLFIIVLLIACFSASANERSERAINVSIDPRMELLSVIQYLGGYDDLYEGLITRLEFPYKDAVKNYFGEFGEHLAVTLFAEMSKSGFVFDAPLHVMLHLTEPPALDVITPFSDLLIQRAGGNERLEKFIAAMRDFSEEAKFNEFFLRHQDTYDKIISITQDSLDRAGITTGIENYYGMSGNSYNLIMVPLLQTGGFGPSMQRPDGSRDIYNICGPTGVENSIPVFGSSSRLRYSAWHEFSHSFVNPLSVQFRDEVNKYSRLFEPIAEQMHNMHYGTWEICVNEHIVRAVTARMSSIFDGERAGKISLQQQKQLSFAYIDSLASVLIVYEKNRDKYPSFKDFYPILIEVFKRLSKSDLGEDFYKNPFKGPINQVYINAPSIIYIIPTNEFAKDIESDIHDYVEKMRDRFIASAAILTDIEALDSDLSQNNIIAYGTIKGNLWIKKNFESLADFIKPDKIITDRVHEGENLRFISTFPNPENFEKGVILYIAQQAADVVKINSIYHGPTDYIVCDGKTTLQAADYNKNRGVWAFR